MISIIVTTFNRELYLKETIKSILNQSFKNFELIVVDDYSNYDIDTLIKNFNDNRIILLKNDSKKNIARNRNLGLKHSKNEIIAFCDDDDTWEKDKLQKQINFINKGYNFVFTNLRLVNYDNNFKVYKRGFISYLIFNVLSTSLSYKILKITNRICLSSVLLKKELIRNYNFSEEDSLYAKEDYDLWLRIYLNSKLYYLKAPLVNYRIHNNNSSRVKI